ncbi:MAG: hypothetical protein RI988_1098 [Pseudomonadota bacterium]
MKELVLDPTDPLQAYYAARAREYDRVYGKPERQPELRAIEAWLPTVFAGRRVLELACGTGWWTRVLAVAARHVTALDATEETLAIARSRGVAADRVRFVQGDAYVLPVELGELDACFAGFWWSHVPRARLQSFLEGVHGRLRPGSPVVFLDNRYVEGSSTPIGPADAAGDTWQLRKLADGSEHRVLKNFPGEGELRDAVAAVDPSACVLLWRHYWALMYWR